MKIATAIGVYYWTGFAGGAIITGFQLWRVLFHKEENGGATSVATAKRHVYFLIVGLALGTVTLLCQAAYPHCAVHTMARFIQGFAGSFIFFYTFLLGVSLFKDQQQVFAMTAASCALNVAEVLGSFLGAVLFDIWGQSAVFWFLGAASVLNQAVLLGVVYIIKPAEGLEHPPFTQASPQGTPCFVATPEVSRICCLPAMRRSGLQNLKKMFRSRRLGCAVVLIVTAAMVKGSVEEILPFHADHRWGYDPMQIGKLFSIIAFAYIAAAAFTGKIWQYLRNYRIVFGAYWLTMLGGLAWVVFEVNAFYKRKDALCVSLAFYGVCLGMTHTPAALLLADAIEHEDGAAKDAVNGIWNTMWEAGGSLGFLMGGLLANEYQAQVNLMTVYVIACLVASMTMLAIGSDSDESSLKPRPHLTDYGCVQ